MFTLNNYLEIVLLKFFKIFNNTFDYAIEIL